MWDLLIIYIILPLFEFVIFRYTYWAGFAVLKFLTIGGIQLAPASTLIKRNRWELEWQQDWSLWLEDSQNCRQLNAWFTCLVGILASIAVGLGIYLVFL